METLESQIQGKVKSSASVEGSASVDLATDGPPSVDLAAERRETNAVRSMLGVAEGLSGRKSLTIGGPSLSQRRESMKKAMNQMGIKSQGNTLLGGEEAQIAQVEQQLGGPRTMVTLNLRNGTAVERPILLETRELERPRLDALLADIRGHRNAELAVNLERQDKMRSLKTQIMDLKYKRLDYGLDVWAGQDPDGNISEVGQSMQPTTWRQVNKTKARKNKGDKMHDVAPMERVNFLRSVEGQVRELVNRPAAPKPRKDGARGSIRMSVSAGQASARTDPESAERELQNPDRPYW